MLKKIIYLFFRYTNYSITIIFIGNNVIAASNTLPTNILSDHTGIIEALLEKKQDLIKTSNDRSNDRMSHLENINNKIQSINHSIEKRKEELEDIEYEDSELSKLNDKKKLYEQYQQNLINSDESSTESLEKELKKIDDMISKHSNFDEGHIVTSTPKKSQSSRSDNLDALTSSLDLSSDNGINIFNDCNLELDAVSSGGNQTNHNTPNSSYNSNQNLEPSDRNNDIEGLNLKDELDAVDGSGGNQTNHNTPNSSYNSNQNLEPSDRNNDIEGPNLKDELDAVDGNGGNQTNHNTPNSSYNSNQNLEPSDRNNDIEGPNLKDELDAVDGNGGNQTNHNTPNSSYNSNQNLEPSDRNNDIEGLNLKDELDAVDGSGGNQTNHNTPNSSYNSNQNLEPSDRNNDIEGPNLKDELDAVDGNGGNQTNHNTPNSSYNSNQNLEPSDRNNDIEGLNLKDELDAVDGSGGNQTNHNTPNSSYNSNQNLESSDRNNNIEDLNLKDELKEPSSRILDRISQFRASNNEVMLALKMFYQIIQNRLIGLNGKSQPISGGDEQNRGFSIWDNSGYAISKQDSGSSISSYTGRMLAIILGGEISFNDSYILGIAYGNIHSYLRFSETLGKSRINSHMVSAYYQKDLDRNVSLQLIGSLSGSNIKNVINAQRHGKSYIRGMGIEGNLSYYHNFTSGMQLVPNISLKYYNMLNNLYKEQGAYDYLLKISRKSRKVFNCTIGSKIILNSTDINSHLKLIPSLQGSIERNFFASHKAITATFTSNQDIPKEIKKVDMTRNSRLGYNIGAGVIAQNNNIKLQFDYNYYMHKTYSTHSGTITVRFDL
ncbi:autotransporter domain-containing protein [Rickettsia endosymbiont of Polydrusus tereticollis]|uniref:autotransporter family protein n=1 Tax=Rickettsia endosymbiont of Polydrusus tereticollis TaxID=3066251 RepID=UPI003132C371